MYFETSTFKREMEDGVELVMEYAHCVVQTTYPIIAATQLPGQSSSSQKPYLQSYIAHLLKPLLMLSRLAFGSVERGSLMLASEHYDDLNLESSALH